MLSEISPALGMAGCPTNNSLFLKDFGGPQTEKTPFALSEVSPAMGMAT